MNPKGTIKNYYQHNNEYVKTKFSNEVAAFAPLWKLAGATGGVVGGLKGALEQDPYGEQITPGDRLMRVATSGLAGAGLGAAVGGGLPQLLKEAPEARQIANTVNEATGINVDPNQIPISLKERIATKRAAKRIVKPTKPNRYIQNTKDVISQGIEDMNQFVVNPIRQAPGKIMDTYDAITLSPAEQALKQETKKAIAQRAEVLRQAAIDQGIDQAVSTSGATEKAKQLANQMLEQENKTPIDKVLDPFKNTIEAGKKTRQVVTDTKNKALEIDRKGKDWLNKKFNTNFSESTYPVNFGLIDPNRPYITGAKLGAIGGAVAGGIYGINQGINQGVESDQNQLNQIQAIPDPYARKQQWDIYDSDLSRAGRALGNTTNTVGQTGLNVGIGLGAGALIGGAGLTAYNNLKNKKFNLIGEPQIGRGEALKILLRGNR